MRGEIGFEHYFMNYFLYLPYSMDQELNSIVETLKIFNELNLFKNEEFDLIINRIENFWEKINKISEEDILNIQKNLNLPNKRKIDLLRGILNKEFGNIFKCKLNEISYYNEFDDKYKNIIYGDFKMKNENVEVYLNQRTMKKVKYKKREFNLIHPINKNVINNVLNNKEKI
jgi:hypothetical protein